MSLTNLSGFIPKRYSTGTRYPSRGIPLETRQLIIPTIGTMPKDSRRKYKNASGIHHNSSYFRYRTCKPVLSYYFRLGFPCIQYRYSYCTVHKSGWSCSSHHIIALLLISWLSLAYQYW